ncbi:hypothetical protein [Streptomyces sp. IGB124]|uniref:hypothetical protein n=1 Tax=Streptomyces sp. IGB124 TaxID=1519485 RepID=UPI0006AE25FC|nr:hypothetical protein [Streptomyces sp. IGB124]KOU56896.1 hypothetical protein ADK96_37335 [Streptomyces sp. IGB124]
MLRRIWAALGNVGRVVVGLAAVVGALAAVFAPLHVWPFEEEKPAPTVLGGLNLYAYCQYKGFAASRLQEEVRTVKDWQCVHADGSTTPITSNGLLSWDEACQYQYGPDAVASNAAPGEPPLRVRCVRG